MSATILVDSGVPKVQCPNCGYEVAVPEGASFTPCEDDDMERVKQVARNNGSNGQLCPQCSHPYCDDCSGIATLNPPRRGCCQCLAIRPTISQNIIEVAHQRFMMHVKDDPAPHNKCDHPTKCNCQCTACAQAREAPQDIVEIARQADAKAALDTIEAGLVASDVWLLEQERLQSQADADHDNRATPLPKLVGK